MAKTSTRSRCPGSGEHRRSRIRSALALAFAFALLQGCATRSLEPFEYPDPQFAVPPADTGVLADLAAGVESRHGPDVSGFALLDRNSDALRWRLALIDSAQSSIDAQYYLWYGDASGRVLMKRILDAADRGVRVRLLVDDLNTLLHDATTVGSRDEIVAWVDSHPNVELRLFNPWSNRNLASRIGESLGNFERVNHRMHNKALIVDNRVAIIGGRNIGDEYLGLNEDFNFHDLDVLGVGPVAGQASAEFDEYWNSRWVVPATALGFTLSDDERAAGQAEMHRKLAAESALAGLSLEPRDWNPEIDALSRRLHPGRSEVVADVPLEGGFDMVMLEHIRSALAAAETELLIVNAYIIPTDHGIAILEALVQRGGRVKILTNSLASHDVPAVNSHYRRWRKPILATGAELYELRHDAAVKASVADTAPVESGFVGLHSKAMLIDGRRAFIGSMNYDPRSAIYNTEMGVFIDSPELGAEFSALVRRDIDPANSWQVSLDDDGKLVWTNDEDVVTRQPARNFWQRVQDVLFRAVPKQYY